MNPARIALVFAFGLVAGCMTAGPPLTAQGPPPVSGAAATRSPVGATLVLDPFDLRLGSTVQFSRIPNRGEIHDLQQTRALTRLVLVLPAWPASYGELQPLEQLGDESDVLVVVPGYPDSREAIEAWNLLAVRTRIIAVVDAPPPSNSVVADLNAMRGLERVIARVDPPSRSGFERLQRPMSFWKVVE